MNMQGTAHRFAAREWLLPLGDGGFAAGTVAGIRARAYHGLLVVVDPAGGERRLLAAAVDDALEGGEGEIPLSARHHEPDVIHPDGHRHVVEFRDTPSGPRWLLEAGDVRLERTITTSEGRVRITWRLVAGDNAALTARPFLTDRSYHGGREAVDGRLEMPAPGRARWVSEHGRGVVLATSGVIRADAVRHDRFRQQTEADRGLACTEDLGSPCIVDLVVTRAAPAWLELAAESDASPPSPPPAALAGDERGVVGRLRRATAAFCLRARDGRPGVLAGYPWFNEWGRDTMIAASGLAEAVGWEPVLEILEAWAARLSRGMIPNRLAETESADLYNSVDAALWMLVAIERAAAAAARPEHVLARFHEVAREIVHHHRIGTRHGIRIDGESGLLTAGEGSTQLTWMDAKIGDRPITPRHGCCVEINALYHAGLGLVERMARVAGHERDAADLAATRTRLAASMVGAFAAPGRPWIRDVLDDRTDALRPNVLIALGAPRSPFPAAPALATLAAVRRELLTPCGLRTLAPSDPRYRGRCRGGVVERDEAYHQGTVWPWLIGPWVDAELAYRGRAAIPELRRAVSAVTRRILGRVIDGHVPEIFDADAPHEARGAPAQAWSAAELLRVHRLLGLADVRGGGGADRRSMRE